MSLPAATAADWRRRYEWNINRRGTTLIASSAPGTPFLAHFADPSHTDIAAVNAFGLQVRIVRKFELPEVKEYEILTDPNGIEWTVHAAHPMWVNDEVIGQKLYVMQ